MKRLALVLAFALTLAFGVTLGQGVAHPATVKAACTDVNWTVYAEQIAGGPNYPNTYVYDYGQSKYTYLYTDFLAYQSNNCPDNFKYRTYTWVGDGSSASIHNVVAAWRCNPSCGNEVDSSQDSVASVAWLWQAGITYAPSPSYGVGCNYWTHYNPTTSDHVWVWSYYFSPHTVDFTVTRPYNELICWNVTGP